MKLACTALDNLTYGLKRVEYIKQANIECLK